MRLPVSLRPIRPSSAVAGGRDLTLPGDGIRLAGTRWPGTGPPVLLLHGLASTRRFWNLVATRLAGLPMIALDLRGHGDSEQPDDGYDTETVVRDVTTALDAAGVSRVVVVGHSWGAVVALSLAALRPERVLAVVAVDGGLSSPGRHFASREEAREALAPPDLAIPPEQITSMLREHSPLGDTWSTDLEDSLLPIFGVDDDGVARARLRRHNHLRVVDALYDYDPAATLARVSVPAWIAVAMPLDAESAGQRWNRDKPEALEQAGRLLRAPRLLTLGGAVHDVPLQWPAVVAGIVRAAVDEVAPRGPAEDA